MKKKFFSLVMLLIIALVLSSCGNENVKSSTNSEDIETEKTYSVTINDCKNGNLSVNKTKAKCGETIIITVTPNNGYMLDEDSLSYTYGSTTNKISNNSFVMPYSNVKISATFLKQCKVNFMVDGKLEYTEIVKEGSSPYKYRQVITNKYYVLNVYSDSTYKKTYYSTNKITTDTTLYCERKLCLYDELSKSKNSVNYSSTSENNILTNVITNAGCTLYSPAYLKLSLKVGDLAIITTNTTYLKMSERLMMSLAGDRGEVLNGGSFDTFIRTEDFYGHSVLIMSVTKPGDYYVAVTYSTAAINEFGLSFLQTFTYKFDVTAAINDGYLL